MIVSVASLLRRAAAAWLLLAVLASSIRPSLATDEDNNNNNNQAAATAAADSGPNVGDFPPDIEPSSSSSSSSLFAPPRWPNLDTTPNLQSGSSQEACVHGQSREIKKVEKKKKRSTSSSSACTKGCSRKEGKCRKKSCSKGSKSQKSACKVGCKISLYKCIERCDAKKKCRKKKCLGSKETNQTRKRCIKKCDKKNNKKKQLIGRVKCNLSCYKKISIKLQKCYKSKCSKKKKMDKIKLTCEDECKSLETLSERKQCMADYCQPAATVQQCPVGSTPEAAPVLATVGNGIPLFGCEEHSGVATTITSSPLKVALKVSKPNFVCIISRTSDGVSFGRSYDGRGWEATAPSEKTNNILPYTCGSPSYCEVVLPATDEDGNDAEYQLVSFSHYAPRKHAVSRFLSQATFGPTLSEIKAFPKKSSGEPNYSEWIRQQMYDVPASLHREYCRKRSNQRWVNSPTRSVRSRNACDPMSRWHRFTFNKQDKDSVIRVVKAGKMRLLKRNGIIMTEVTELLVTGTAFKKELPWTTFVICAVEEKVGGVITVRSSSMTCQSKKIETIENPPIHFTSRSPAKILEIPSTSMLVKLEPPIPDARLLKHLTRTTCSDFDAKSSSDMFLKNRDGTYYRHDPRIRLLENTLASPSNIPILPDKNLLCPSAPVSFLNHDFCRVVQGNACATPQYTSTLLTLDASTMRLFYTLSGRYVYAISGLRLSDEDSPCSTSRSRWIRESKGCDGEAWNDSLPSGTLHTLIGHLQDNKDPDSFIQDIEIAEGSECNAAGMMANMLLEVDESDGTLSCWRFVHPNTYDIYDFTHWTNNDGHPGNLAAADGGRPNPISRLAELDESTTLVFPSWHPMTRWNPGDFTLLGRLGDKLSFIELPEAIQTKELAISLGALEASIDSVTSHSLICGSPGESANEPSLGSRFPFHVRHFRGVRVRVEDQFNDLNTVKSVSLMVVLKARDQLRQRVAFALYGILVIATGNMDFEGALAYYDIFTRNAFTNYLDVLKEVTFSPMMGRYLTYMGRNSFAFNGFYPDENYAREIMQLFSIGLVKLNIDGTVQVDKDTGEPIPTYTNDDIMTFAKVFTGFNAQALRGNLPDHQRQNDVDPMHLNTVGHDGFPKLDLHGNYIGDRYPLCVDLPAGFTHTGAKFVFIGTTNQPALELSPTQSQLYQRLCNKESGIGPCQYLPVVILDQSLECFDIECDVGNVDLVKVGSVAYRYMRSPCVSLYFYNRGRTIDRIDRKWARDEVCLDPRVAGAGVACCDSNPHLVKTCQPDQVTYAVTETQCTNKGQQVCSNVQELSNCPSRSNYHVWTNRECTIQVKVDLEGQIAAVHDVQRPQKDFHQANQNWFRVKWDESYELPNAETNNCDSCITMGSSCLCNITVLNVPGFQSIPTSQDILSQLHIGIMPPDAFGQGTYVQEEGPVQLDGVRIFKRANGVLFDTNTVFEVSDEFGSTIYLQNLVSEVSIVGSNAAFRNPPSFLGLIEQTNNPHGAKFEVTAFLQMLVNHPNTAPFIAYRFIQRLVTSNPSPRYVARVAKAFQDGYFEGFGTGKNGDLAATVAAILLDPEARSAALDADPTHGQLREPLLKLIYALRSLEFQTQAEHQIELRSSLATDIGQQFYQPPSVFSFFQPEFSPSGTLVRSMGIVAPESQILDTQTSLSFMNSMLSLASHGLSGQRYGFALRTPMIADRAVSLNPSLFINELDLLLTNGRLSAESRSSISASYGKILKESGKTVADSYALQLFFTSPEFHITNAPKNHCFNSEASLAKPFEATTHIASSEATTSSHKAIVYLSLDGGADSFNMLVPHSDCSTPTDLYEQYQQIRGTVAIEKRDLLHINSAAGQQPCNKFGMHPNLKAMRRLYEDGHLIWISNVGTLVEPLTKQNLKRKRKPPGIFAHNTMTRNLEIANAENYTNSVGLLGRMADALSSNGYATGAFSIRGSSRIQENVYGRSPPTDHVSPGPAELFQVGTGLGDDFEEVVGKLLKPNHGSSAFGNIWASTLQRGIARAATLHSATKATTLKADSSKNWKEKTSLEFQLKKVAKLLGGRHVLGTNRNTFSVKRGNFDAHNNLYDHLDVPLKDVDSSLSSFVAEMKAQGIWDDIVIVIGSEFGRTLTSNGGGTDHGWGGNTFILGGSVKGGRILGEYPADLTRNSPYFMSRARVIPTTPFEAIWNGVAEWFGVTDGQLDEVLPLRKNFDNLFTKDDLFEH